MTCTMVTMYVYIIIGSSNPFIVYEFMTIVCLLYDRRTYLHKTFYYSALVVLFTLCSSGFKYYYDCNILFYDFYLKAMYSRRLTHDSGMCSGFGGSTPLPNVIRKHLLFI